MGGGDEAGRLTERVRGETSGRSSSRRLSGGNVDDEKSGIFDESVLMLVFRSMNWDPRVVGITACVSRRMRAVAKRVLWKELCISRAPRIVHSLMAGNGQSGGGSRQLGAGWDALAKLFLYCCGCAPSDRFLLNHASPGHLLEASRFSKTSGRSFLARRCQGDLLYVSDPCEHAVGATDDVGVYRGVFRAFMRSRTRECLIGRRAELDPRVRCPYCNARVWSMTAARLVPRSAARRLGAKEEALEYFVCVYGHLHGKCWLAHLSSSSTEDEDDDDDDGDGDGGAIVR